MSCKSSKNKFVGKRAGGFFILLLLVLFCSACSFGRLDATDTTRQLLLSAEHQPGFQGAGKAQEPSEKKHLAANNETGQIPQWGVEQDDFIEDVPEDFNQEGDKANEALPPSPSPLETPTPTPTPTVTPTPTATPTPTVTPTPILGVYEKNGSYENIPSFTGTSFVITDYQTGEVILAKESGKQIFPASTIKMLTALTALDYKDMVSQITAKQSVLSEIPFDAYSYGVEAGSTFSLEVWLHLLMISSYADAADTIAAGCGGTVEKFISYMNTKATELGLSHTHVDNAIGLDTGNGFSKMYSTAEDIAKLARAYMRNTALAEIVKKAEYQVPDCEITIGEGEEKTTKIVPGKKIESSNYFLSKSDTYHSELFDVIGTKSGRTDAAGTCQVITAISKSGKKYICCYFGGANRDTIFREIKGLLEYCCGKE